MGLADFLFVYFYAVFFISFAVWVSEFPKKALKVSCLVYCSLYCLFIYEKVKLFGFSETSKKVKLPIYFFLISLSLRFFVLFNLLSL